MSKYDNSFKYDVGGSEGFFYDYQTQREIKHVYDTVSLTDSTKINAIMALKEVIDFVDIMGVFFSINIAESINVSDSISAYPFIDILESLHMTEDFVQIMAMLYVVDDSTIIADQVAMLNMVLMQENINIDDNISINALMEISDKYSLSELTGLLANLQVFEEELIIDKDPRTAVSDYFIGKVDGFDPRFSNYFMPLGLRIDMRDSDIPVMPTSESTYIDVPGMDGTIVQNTTYRNRLFSLVGYSFDGLTPEQKEVLKEEIAILLDETKDKTQKLTFAKNDLSFDVKFAGEAEITEGASYVRAVLPFEATPYGYKIFPEEFNGDGIIINNGHAIISPIITINGGCVNPNFFVGETEFLWQATVPSNKTLIIDCEDKTCYLKDEFGETEQAMNKLIKGISFVSIDRQQQAVVRALNESTLNSIHTLYSPRYLWLSLTTSYEGGA